jgi:transcriptional regulator with XRE-family HTH domain
MRHRKAYPTLREYLDAEGIEQQILAKRAKITQGHLSLILRGERTPSLPLALRLAKIANVPVESLVGKLHTDDGA